MKVGLMLGTELPAREPLGPRLDSILRQVSVARDYGFDCISVGQHYLSWPLQIIQPLPLLGRLAAEAGDMWLGTGILLLPLLHPVDIAEQVATLDHICGGKFIFGIGLGYEEEEFHAFGLQRRDRVARFEESLEVITRLWTEDRVTFKGKHFSLDDVVPSARPLQSPHPPIWIAANNHPGVQRAGRLGHAWYANPHAVLATLAEQMGLYRAALAEGGHEAPADMPFSREIFVAGSREEAIERARPYLEKRYQVYVEQGQDEALPPGDRFNKPFEELAKDRFIFGNPEECAQELKRYEALGFNYALLDYQWVDMNEDQAMECLHLMGSELLPLVK